MAFGDFFESASKFAETANPLSSLEAFSGGPSSASTGDVETGGIDFGNLTIGGAGTGLSLPSNPLIFGILGIVVLGAIFAFRQ